MRFGNCGDTGVSDSRECDTTAWERLKHETCVVWAWYGCSNRDDENKRVKHRRTP